jgi:hypothetical protein
MTDFRALCAELLRSLENYPVQPFRDRDLCIRARAALAKQPSLKEQALKALEQLLRDPEAGCFAAAPDTIRRALEALPND